MTTTARPVPALSPAIGTSARSFDEYRTAFDLTPDDVRGRVLDCPGGAASLAAGIAEAGGHVVAVDPLYALGADDLRDRVHADVEALRRSAERRIDEFDLDAVGTPAERARLRGEAVETFLSDVNAHPERYLAAALPELPFADGEFDLALTSYLLFTYADVLSVDDHVSALVELARVATEVRVYPLVDSEGNPLPELVRAVISRLKKARLACRIEPVTSPFQRAATTRLVVEPMRRPDGL